MKYKCSHCQVNDPVYYNTYNYEGTIVKIRLCDKCLKNFITALLDLVDYRWYRNLLEKFGNKVIERK